MASGLRFGAVDRRLGHGHGRGAVETAGRDAAADVTTFEWEIDELVYALYGLTKEEKALVQSAAK